MESFLASKRKQLNLSQRQLADSLGYAPQLVSLWEKGKSYPDLAVWSQYAYLLQLTLEAFLTEGNNRPHAENGLSFDAQKFAANLKQLRERKGLTQGDLAHSIGVNIKTVSNWERGISFPNKERFLQLSVLFHCSIDELYFALEPRPPIVPEAVNVHKTKRVLLVFLALFVAISLTTVGTVLSLRPISADPNRQSQEETPSSIQTPEEKHIVTIKLIESNQHIDTYEIVYDDGSAITFTLNGHTGKIVSSVPLPNLSYENGFFLIDGTPTEFKVETTFVDLSKPCDITFINNTENLIMFGIVYPRKNTIVDFFQLDYKGDDVYHIYSQHDVYLTEGGSCVIDDYDTGIIIDFDTYYPETVSSAAIQTIEYMHSEGNLDYYDLVMETGFEIIFTYDAPRQIVTIGNSLFREKISLSDSKGFWCLNGAVTNFRVHSSAGPYDGRVFSVRWLEHDGTLIKQDRWTEGCIPVFAGAGSLSYYDGKVYYDFSYWSPEIVSIHEDCSYTANYAGNLNNRSYRLVYDAQKQMNLIDGFSLDGFNEEVLYLPITCEGTIVDGIISLPEDFPADLKVYIPSTYSYIDESIQKLTVQ